MTELPPQNTPSAVLPSTPIARATWITAGLLGLALLILTFIGGFFVGHARAGQELSRLAFAKRQLTENLDKPIGQRPLLKQLGPRGRDLLKQHGLQGTIVEVKGDALVLDTPDGERSITLTSATKLVDGPSKGTLDRSALTAGARVIVLSKQKTQPQQPEVAPIDAAVVIVNPPALKPAPNRV